MSLGEGKEARGEPASRYKAQNWTPELRPGSRRRPSPGRNPSCLLRFPPRETLFSPATGAEEEKFPHVPLWILNNNKNPPQRPQEPVPRPSPHGVPGPARLTCGLRRGAALRGRGAGRRASEQQQQRQQQQQRRWRTAAPGGGGAEESPGFALRRHLYPTSGGGGGGDSAAERSRPSLSAPQPVSAPQGSAPARPGPARAAPSRAQGERLRAPPSCSGAGRRAEENQYIPAESRGVARSLQVPGAATRRRLGLLTVERGGRRPRGGGRAPERAVPRTLTAAHARLPPHEHPLRAPRPAGLQSRRSLRGQPRRWSRAGAGAGGGPAPLPHLALGRRARARGARAGLCCCCWRQGNPGEAIRLLRLPPPAPNPRERFPLTSADRFKGYGDLRQSRTDSGAAHGGREPARTSLPRASI